MIDLRVHYGRLARRFMRLFAARVRRGQGVGGRALRDKERPDGRPLGGASIPRDLRAGAVTATDDGFVIRYGRSRNLERFHSGTPGGRQVPRPVYGLTKKEKDRIRELTRREVVRQANKGVR